MAPCSRYTRGQPGVPISPTIFNLIVDAVIHLWVTLVEGEGMRLDGSRWAVQWLAEFF